MGGGKLGSTRLSARLHGTLVARVRFLLCTSLDRINPMRPRGMQIQNVSRLPLLADGVVRRVDPVGREMDVHVAGTSVSFDVRPDCVITLRGERIKLRLVQPRDRVRVAFRKCRGTRIADAIVVQPEGPAPF